MFYKCAGVISICSLLLMVGCGSSSQPASSGLAPAASKPRLQGAGSTFDAPLFSKVFDALEKEKGIEVNYQSIGSGGGVKQLTSGTVDFGASDFPLNDEQTRSAEGAGGPVVHVPVTMGAVSVGYNLQIDSVKLDADTLSRIYLGEIKRWNDPRIAALNNGVTLPSTPVVVVHRTEGSGTTFIFTSYLSSVNAEWKSKVGAAGAVQWPAGVGAKGSEGVSGQVTNTPGAIGYFELGVREGKSDQVGAIEKRGGQVRRAERRGRCGGGRRSSGQHAVGFEGGLRQRAGRRQLPDCRIQLDHRVQEPEECSQRSGDHRSPPLHGHLRPAVHREFVHYAPLPKVVQDLDEKVIQMITVPNHQ